MKNLIIIACLALCMSLNAQKKKNGTVYIEHPGIDLVEDFNEAWVSGDIEKMASYLADDFKIGNGTNLNKDAEGRSKERFIGQMKWWSNNFEYTRFEASGGFPDLIDYKEGGIWVQTWDHLYSVHSETGVKIDMPIHRLYRLTDDAKLIKGIVEYNNQNAWNRLSDSWTGKDRENGTIYMNHEHINTVRKLLVAAENGDMEKAYSYMDENAKFNDINFKEPVSMDQVKENDKAWLSKYDITSIDQVGYPDYLEYDQDESKVVLSWWKIRMKRKSDGKEVVLPIHYSHRFNDEGKIAGGSVYYSPNAIED